MSKNFEMKEFQFYDLKKRVVRRGKIKQATESLTVATELIVGNASR